MSDSIDQAIRDIFKGASVVYVGLLLEILIAFLAQLLAARYLTTGDFGGITTGTALVNLGAIVGSIGLNEGLLRYLPRTDDSDRSALVRASFAISLPIGLALGLAMTLGADWIAGRVFRDPTVATSIRVFGAAIPFAAVLMVAIGAIRGQEESRYRVYVENLLRPVSRFSLVVVAVVYGLGQWGFAMAYAVPYVLGAALAILLLRRSLPDVFASPRVDVHKTAELLRYSLPMTASKAAGFVYRSADIFIVLYFADAGAVGAYGVAYAAARLVLMFSAAFNFLGAPIASRLEANQGVSGMVAAHRPILRWIIVFSIPVLFPLVVLPHEFISTVYRPRYAAGSGALTVLALGFGVHNVFSTQGNLLRGLGMSKPLAFNGVVAAALNVVLNLILVPEYGILGAALATVAAYFMMNALMTVELYHYSDVMLLTPSLAVPVVLGVPAYAVGWALAQTRAVGLVSIVVLSGLVAAVYWVSVLGVLGLYDEDVMMLRSVVERFGLPAAPVETVIAKFERND